MFVDDEAAFVAGELERSIVLSSDRQVDGVATVDRLWDDALTGGTRLPGFRLVRDGSTLATSAYCRRAGVGHRSIDDLMQPNRVLELYDDGATLVLQGLQLSDPHLGRFANNLALALDQPVQVNAYLSPPSARGLDLHVDLHDVFVVQLDGVKRWRVWEPTARTELPVKGGPAIGRLSVADLGSPAIDRELRRGDVLYLPRGHPHCAETVDSASAHLTVGILAITWLRVAHAAVDAAVRDGRLRGSVRSSAGAADVAAALEPHLGGAAVRRWMITEIWRRQPATRLRPRDVPTVELAAPLRVTPGPLVWVERTDDRCTVGLGDRTLVMPVEAHGFVSRLVGAEPAVAPADVDGLDGASKCVVVERLLGEGVVTAG